jgi:hypothetical protein
MAMRIDHPIPLSLAIYAAAAPFARIARFVARSQSHRVIARFLTQVLSSPRAIIV